MRKYYKILSIKSSDLIWNEISNEYNEYVIEKDKNGNPIWAYIKGTLNQSLDTIKLEKLCRSHSDIFPHGFTDHRKKCQPIPYSENCIGYSTAIINIEITNNNSRSKLYKNGFKCDGHKYVRYKRSSSSARSGHCLFIHEKLYSEMMNWSSCGLNCNQEKLATWESYISLTLSGIEHDFTLNKSSILIIRDRESSFPTDNSIIINRSDIDFSVSNETLVSPRTHKIWDGQALLDESVFEALPESYTNSSMLLLRGKFFKSCAFRTKLQKWFNDNHITEISQLGGITTAQKITDIKLVITESSLKYLKFFKNIDNETTLRNAFISWLNNSQISPSQKKLQFGIVKSDHPTKYVGGSLVQTNYQMLNTIGFQPNEIQKLLSVNLHLIYDSNQDHTIFRDVFLNLKAVTEKNENCDSIINTRNSHENHSNSNLANYKTIIYKKLLNANLSFSKTKNYIAWKKELLNSFVENCKKGKILIQGTYATLFGNPIEFLYATIHKEYDPSNNPVLTDSNNNPIYTLNRNQIFCSHFDDNELVCGVRSPHITMGNLLLCVNCVPSSSEIELYYQTYFSLSPEIVCINSINSDILQRLNGADFDSDQMLITNDSIICNAVARQYNLFKVPVNGIDEDSKPRCALKDLSELDSTIATNRLGEIVNLSQSYNTIFWNRFSNKITNPQVYSTENSLEDISIDAANIYTQICTLAILSNLEVDKAKHSYPYDFSSRLQELRELKSLLKLQLTSAHYWIELDEPEWYRKYVSTKKFKWYTINKHSIVFPYQLFFCEPSFIEHVILNSIFDYLVSDIDFSLDIDLTTLASKLRIYVEDLDTYINTLGICSTATIKHAVLRLFIEKNCSSDEILLSFEHNCTNITSQAFANKIQKKIKKTPYSNYKKYMLYGHLFCLAKYTEYAYLLNNSNISFNVKTPKYNAKLSSEDKNPSTMGYIYNLLSSNEFKNTIMFNPGDKNGLPFYSLLNIEPSKLSDSEYKAQNDIISHAIKAQRDWNLIQTYQKYSNDKYDQLDSLVSEFFLYVEQTLNRESVSNKVQLIYNLLKKIDENDVSVKPAKQILFCALCNEGTILDMLG